MTDWYVNSNSGNNASNGSQQNPWKTIQYAFGKSQPGDTIWLMGESASGWPQPTGIYREAIAGKSGTVENPIRVKAFPGHRVIISALDEIGGWVKHSGNIYSTTAANWTLNTASRPQGNNLLFYSKPGQIPQPLPEARWPKIPQGKRFANLGREDFAQVDSATPGIGAASGDLVTSTIVDAALGTLPSLTGACCTFYGGAMWTSLSGKITSHSGNAISINHQYKPGEFYPLKAENRYFLFGSLNLLTSPGEWFRDDTSGIVYLWMPDGSNPANWKIEFKRREKLLDLWGRSNLIFEDFTILGGRVNANLSGLSFINCQFINGTHHLYTSQVYEFSAPVLNLVGGNGRAINCTFKEAPAAVIEANSSIISGCKFQNFSYLGASGAGVKLSGTNNLVENCVFDGCGGARMIDIQSSATLVQNNTLSNGSRITLDEGAIFAWRGTDGGPSKTRVLNNRISVDLQLFDLAKKHYGYAYIYIENVQNFVFANNICSGTARVAMCPAQKPAICSVEISNNVFDTDKFFWQPSEKDYDYTGTTIKNNSFRRLFSGVPLRKDVVFENNSTTEVEYANNVFAPDKGLAIDGDYA